MLFVAAAALIDSERNILLAQRPEGKPMAGLWEFPGGKVESHETPEVALVRELREELGIQTSVQCLRPITFVTHALANSGQPEEAYFLDCDGCNPASNSPDLDPEDQLLLMLYSCYRWEGSVTPREGQALTWASKQELLRYPMPPADKPLIAVLRDVV